jgi:Uma2 family endonuclease
VAVTTGADMARAHLARLEAAGKLDEGLRYEILRGELVIRGSPLVAHARAVSVLDHHFRAWTDHHGGETLVDVGVEIGDHQLAPDLSFIRPERVGELDPRGFYVPPDLMAEVTSPGTRSLALVEKREIYAEIGVGECWVVDPTEKRVLLDRRAAGGDQTVEATSGTLTTPTAPGLEVPVAKLLSSA